MPDPRVLPAGERVRPLIEMSGPVYQPEGLRERLVLQLLQDLGLARAGEAWPLPTMPPSGDEDEAFANLVWKRLIDRATKGSSGEIHAARFVANVWGNQDLIKRVGAFDLVQAFMSWDDAHRAIVAAWCREPWLA